MRARLPLAILAICGLVAIGAADAHPRLGKPKSIRAQRYIVDFKLHEVVPRPDITGHGGITAEDTLKIDACVPDCPQPRAQPFSVDAGDGLELRVTPGQKILDSGQGQNRPACTYSIRDVGDETKFAELTAVPTRNVPSAVLRRDDIAYVSVQYNGYASPTAANGNLIVALDLAAHRELWRTPSLVSNAAMLMWKDVLITGYGFTAEPDALFVFDAATGKRLQRIALPKAPEDMVIAGGRLYVRIYDGYAVLEILDR